MMGTAQKNKCAALLITGIALMCNVAGAQVKTYKYKADVQKVDSNGVYRLELSPAIVGKSQRDLKDIRLTDETGKHIAYVLSSKLAFDNPDSFIVFPEVSPANGTDTATVYIAQNKNLLNISQLWIKLKKTGVNRTVNLSGSDDLNKWFAIKEDIPLEEAGAGQEADYQQALTFPTSNYRYFKVQVNGKNKTPVKILQSGIYTTNLNNPVYTQLPDIKYTHTDSSHITQIYISFGGRYQVDKLHFEIAGPRYYNRRIVVNDMRKGYAEPISDSILNSDGLQDVLLSAKTNKLRVDIFNGDDNPLSVRAITGYQLKLYAVTYLEAAHSYFILTGDSLAAPANYDLSFVKKRIYNQLPGISHSAVYNNPAYARQQPLVEHDFSLLLWTAIILALVLLSFFTLKMVREIK